jgi:hypothetical protein
MQLIGRKYFSPTVLARKAAKRLRTRKYPFKPARQVNIPKPGKLFRFLRMQSK